MAWSAPMTAVAGAIFTAAEFNQYVRDNLNETAPAKATAAGGYFVATGVNAIEERLSARATVNTDESTASTSYTDLATVGPSVTVTTGTQALAVISSESYISSGGTQASTCRTSVEISGASSVAATDDTCVCRSGNSGDRYQMSRAVLVTGLTAGSNTFTLKYRVSASTGNFTRRNIAVLPL